jgi:hypothetical protein
MLKRRLKIFAHWLKKYVYWVHIRLLCFDVVVK